VIDDAILWVGDLGFTAPGGQARNIGESFLGGPGTGSGSGSNVWMLPFIVPFGGGTITFEFQADPYIEVSVNPDAPAGTTAAGSLVMTIHGPLPGAPGGTWAPNGLLDVVGEVADPFSLNTGLFQGVPGEDLYDPTGDASFGIDPPTAGAFEATFDAPVSGVLEIRISETVETSKPTGIPEPATLFLVATGLAGLAFARRRKGA